MTKAAAIVSFRKDGPIAALAIAAAQHGKRPIPSMETAPRAA
jgi:hypothetical protein